MNVIGGPVDDESRSTHLANDAAEIGEEVGTEFGFDQRAALVGAEDDVQQDIAAGVRHFFAPSGAWPFTAYPRLAPWAAILRRFAAVKCRDFLVIRGRSLP